MRALTAATAACAVALVSLAGSARAQDAKSFEVYGFAQLDYIQDFRRVDPAWEDTLRPSKIPTTEGVFGGDGQAIVSIKQSRFGVRANLPAGSSTIRTQFEFDLYGVGADAGQTTMRVRHVYGAWGNWLAGQTNTLFMDIDIFPNVVDYWGPNGMVFLRTPQIRWTPVSGDRTFSIALERPGNDIDVGQFRDVDPSLANFQSDEEIPDVTAQFRTTQDWGHLQISGILRKLSVENVANPANIVQRDDTGWGVDVTGSFKLGERNKILWGVVTGAGIASYMNDGGVDMAATAPPGNPTADAQAVDLTGISAYYDHYWNSEWSSSIGYSYDEVDNLAGQSSNAFKKGEYFSANILHYPAENILIGAELLWGTREDFNGNDGDDTRIQFTFKYNFGAKW
jgi:hypothetical protein